MGKQVCGVKLMSPGGREVAPSGDEKEDAGPGLLTHTFKYNFFGVGQHLCCHCK